MRTSVHYNLPLIKINTLIWHIKYKIDKTFLNTEQITMYNDVISPFLGAPFSFRMVLQSLPPRLNYLVP